MQAIGRRYALQWAVVAVMAAATAGGCRPTPPAVNVSPHPDAEAVSLLGEPLRRPDLPPATRALYEQRLTEARRAYDRTPGNADSIIWLGRRTAYLARYREAIGVFTDGIAKHPNDPR